MRYTATAEPNRTLIMAIIFVSIVLIVAILTFTISHFVINENFVLKKTMALLLIGSDITNQVESTADSGTLPKTDTLILTLINPQQHKISLISIPKDTLTDIPGYGLDKINNASALGGYELTKKAVSVLTGVPVNHYALVNYDGFIKLVDLLGGIEINVERRMIYTAEDGNLIVKLDPGLQMLDGKKALEYARFGNEPMGEINRGERQRKLLQAFYLKMTQVGNMVKVPKMINLAKNYVQTDLTSQQITQLLSLAKQIKTEQGFVSATLPGKFEDGYWQTNPKEVYDLVKRLIN